MKDNKIKYELVSCEHYEAARIYSELAMNKLAELKGFKASVCKKDGEYKVILEVREEDYGNLENFLGNIIARLFFF